MRRLLLLASCLALLGCPPSAAQILVMGDWLVHRRPPGVPEAGPARLTRLHCRRLCGDAANSGRTEYLTAQKACAPFISAAGVPNDDQARPKDRGMARRAARQPHGRRQAAAQNLADKARDPRGQNRVNTQTALVIWLPWRKRPSSRAALAVPLNHARKRIGRPPPRAPALRSVCLPMLLRRPPPSLLPPASILLVPSFFQYPFKSAMTCGSTACHLAWIPAGWACLPSPSPDGQVDHVAFVRRMDLTHSLLLGDRRQAGTRPRATGSLTTGSSPSRVL